MPGHDRGAHADGTRPVLTVGRATGSRDVLPPSSMRSGPRAGGRSGAAGAGNRGAVPPPAGSPGSRSTTRGPGGPRDRAPSTPPGPLALRFGALAVLTLLVVVLRWGPLVDPTRAAGLALVGVAAAALGAEAVRRWWEAREAPQPLRPVRRTAAPVVVRPEPPVALLVPADRCRVCGRPMHDPTSRANGVGPDCLRRHGPRPLYDLNPDHVAWGDEVHAGRLRQVDEQRLLDAEFATEERAWQTAWDQWDQERRSPAGLERRAQRAGARRVLAGVSALAVLALAGDSPHTSAAVMRDAASVAAVQPAPAATSGVIPSPTPSPAAPTAPEPASEPGSAVQTEPTAEADLAGLVTAGPAGELPARVTGPGSSTAARTPVSRTPVRTETRPVAPVVQPPPPASLSDAAVLRAEPDCVGGVCTLAARADIVRTPPAAPGTRVTVALVRLPDERYLGSQYRFLAVDARSGAKLSGTSGASSVQPPAEGFRSNPHGQLWMSLAGQAEHYNRGTRVFVLTVDPDLGLRDVGPIVGGADGAAFGGLDGAGRFRWTETKQHYDGSTVTVTYGWPANGYGRYEAVQCARSRNGETVTHPPTYGSCT